MTVKADAWVLYAGDDPKNPVPGDLVRETIEFPDIQDHEVLAQPLYGCWEGNMLHAVQRTPVDVCHQRKEEKVVLGNAGVVRVLQVGKDVRSVEPGQNAIIFCNGVEDKWGYPEKILAFDAPNTMGCLATRMKLTDRQVIPIPENTRHSMAQWAAFSLRYVTAWSNWELAHGVFRLLVHWDEMASPHVWGWGGGVTLAELDLARRHGCRTVMMSGNEIRLQTIVKTGVTPLDRRQFGPLSFDEKAYKADPEYREAYKTAEGRFLDTVREMTNNKMVNIFIDYIGGPVFRPTLKALAREGVITTAGWKEGMQLSTVRAIECIERHQHVHTHYARYPQGWKAVAYAEANGWMPIIDERIYTFDEVPELLDAYQNGRVNCFPTFSIVPD
jgi:NADPH:quinone reductase-like Zn-dependent oxidoreductase